MAHKNYYRKAIECLNKKESDKEVCIVAEEDNNYDSRSVSPNGSISVKVEKSTKR